LLCNTYTNAFSFYLLDTSPLGSRKKKTVWGIVRKNIFITGVGAKGGKESICSSEFSQVFPARPSVEGRLKAR